MGMTTRKSAMAGGIVAGVGAFIAIGLLATSGQFVPGQSGGGTTTTVQYNAYTGTHLEWNVDFLQQAGASTQIEPYLNSSASGTIASNGAAGRPGIWQLSTAASATGRMSTLTQGQVVDFNSGTWTYEWTGCVDTLSSATDGFSIGVGFVDTAAIDQVDGCYFLYDERNAAVGGTNTTNLQKWSCWCSANSVRTTFLMDGSTVSNESFTTVDSPVAACTLPNTNMYRLKVAMTGTTRAEFFIDAGSGYTKRCDINTNIPNSITRATGAGFQIIKSVGTTARTIEVDQARLAVDLNATRSP